MEKYLASTARAIIFSPDIGQNAMPASVVLQKRTSKSSALPDDPESPMRCIDEDYILPVERPQKRHHKVSSGSMTQLSVKPTPIIPGNAKPGRDNKSVAPASSKTRLFGDVQPDALLVGCTAEAIFGDKDLMDWICNARKHTELFIYTRQTRTPPYLRARRPP